MRKVLEGIIACLFGLILVHLGVFGIIICFGKAASCSSGVLALLWIIGMCFSLSISGFGLFLTDSDLF